MYKINVIYGIITLFTTYYQPEKSVTSTGKNSIITAKTKQHDIVFKSTVKKHNDTCLFSSLFSRKLAMLQLGFIHGRYQVL